jgi:hypothetical protein
VGRWTRKKRSTSGPHQPCNGVGGFLRAGKERGRSGEDAQSRTSPNDRWPRGWAAAAEGRARPRAVGGRRPSAAAGRGEQSGWASGCADGWASTRVAQPGEHGGDAKWWLGARARAEAGVRELRAYWAARCGCAGGLGGGAARLARWLCWAEGGAGLRLPNRLGGGGGAQQGRASGKGTVGLVSFLFLFLLFEFMNALQNTSIIQKKMYTSA